MNIKQDTLLKRASDITINVNGLLDVEVTVGKVTKVLSNHTLSILSVFAKPITLAEAMKSLTTTGANDWIKLTQTIQKLHQLGALILATDTLPETFKPAKGFGAPPIHIAMLNDKVRTDCFIEAINQTVKTGDVVLDIGTGTGVLAIAAARAGAKIVYAVEAGEMADVAQAIINDTEVAHKITIIRGWSTDIELPEKATVLVSEIIGNDPFDEDVLHVFRDAKKRLLKPDCLILPDKINVFGLPIAIPSEMLAKKMVNDEQLKNWKEWYGTDFSHLKKCETNTTNFLAMVDEKKLAKLDVFDEPLLLAAIDFENLTTLDFENELNLSSRNTFNGILVYFELQLGNIQLTNHPKVLNRAKHWLNPIWYSPDLEKYKNGHHFKLKYKYSRAKNSEMSLI
jgi:2-polyprenyl-3-methyl-5-hydroxy-6-metoxy-1,4-benzoquinol methylase